MRWYHATAGIIVLAGITTAGWLATQRGQSDPILKPWSEIGGYNWLMPGLKSATVHVIDRPHEMNEAIRSRTWLTRVGRSRAYHLSTNSLRLRGPEIGAKVAGTQRILVIGESVAHGWGLEVKDTWTVKLEAELRGRGIAAEVLNAGVPSAFSEAMRGFCLAKAAALAPDVVIWMRRPVGAGGANALAQGARDCAAVTRARLVVALPPISTFDAHGSGVYGSEAGALRRLLPGVDVIELTDVIRAAQQGKGEVLEHRGDRALVVDQETGKVWLDVPWSAQGLDPSIYTLFEDESSVREALFFDGGHPDEAGTTVLANALADRLGPKR